MPAEHIMIDTHEKYLRVMETHLEVNDSLPLSPPGYCVGGIPDGIWDLIRPIVLQFLPDLSLC